MTEKKNVLRGMAAVGSLMLSTKGRKGGGKRNARGGVNAAHRVLAAMGEPMQGADITATALGLGYWDSSAGSPINGLVHNVNDCLQSETNTQGLFLKPAPGLFELVKDAPAPLVPADPDKPDPLAAAVYTVMVKSDRIKALPGVKLPAVTVKPLVIAEYLAGETVAEADDATKAQIQANAKTIEGVLKG